MISTESKTPKKIVRLDFEKPLLTIADQISELENRVKNNEDKLLLDKLKTQYEEVEANIFKNLTPFDITKVARHPQRPYIQDYLDMLCCKEDVIEMHGDRAGTDDEAMFCALVKLEDQKFIAIGTQKGRNIKENQKRNFGMPQPEGYRKAKRLFEYANKFNLPIVTFIDTPGAYPGLNAEANGQSIAIAENLKSLAGLTVPVLAIVTGEGGSGGALAIGVANRVLMLENSVYSVISPEGCAAILWRTRDKASDAAAALKITAKDLKELKVIEDIIPEPLGGAHRNYEETASNLRESLLMHLKDLKKMSPEELKADRMNKFRNIGVFS